MQILRLAAATLAALVLSACKIQVNVPVEGGTVTTVSGNYSCGAGQLCVIDVSDTSFDESFQAVAAEGYSFFGWRKADRHFCGNQSSNCNLATTGFGGNAILESFLSGENADQVFYIEPVFLPLDSGGAAWLYQAVTCQGWGSDGTGGTTNDPDKIGRSLAEINTEGQDCRDYETINYEESPTTGEPRIRQIDPPLSESAQCPSDPDCGRDRTTYRLTYQQLASQGVLVERVSRIDSYTQLLGYADDHEGIDEAQVYGYESGTESLRRPNKYEVYDLAPHPDTGNPVLTLMQRATWSYNSDGSVTLINLSIYDEDTQDYLSGRIRFAMQSDGLAATTEIDYQGQAFTTGKKVYHDRGILDTPPPPFSPPPTTQIETENDWELPENFTEYTLGDENQLAPELKQEITARSNTADLPVEVITSGWDAVTEQWVASEKVEYGYSLDGEDTAYRILELYYVNESGTWQKNFATINRFNTTPYQITGGQ